MSFSRRLVMRAFSFPAMLASSLAVLAVLTVRSRFSDPDLWWHLRTGQIIAIGHMIPRVDLLSFTTGEHAWVAHEWLTQLLLFTVWKAAGYRGLMLWFCSMTVALLLVEYALCWLYSRNLKVAFVGALIAWFFATIGLAIRPQLVGYLLLACELVLVELGRSRNPRWFLLLPPLFALWVNCHGSFLLGLALLAMVLASSFLPWRAGLIESHQLDPPRRRILAWSSALCLPAIFANPVGFSLLAYPLRTMFDSRMQLDAVTEWRWLGFDDPRSFGLIAVAGVILLLPLLRRTSLYWDEGLMVAAMLGLALLHQRLLFAWGIVAAPVLCRQIAPLWSGYEPGHDRRWLNGALIASALVTIYAVFPKTEELRAQVARNNPVQAVDYLRRAHLSGNILNEYVYGGYLAWALPERRVFIDGRGDVYAWTGVLRDYGNWATLQADPNDLLERYRIGFCLLSRNAPLSRVLPYLPAWRELYSDSDAVIFGRTGGGPQ